MKRLCITLLPFILSMILPCCKQQHKIKQYNEEKILVIGNSAEPQGLDPQRVTGVVESNIIRSLFEGLCQDHSEDQTINLPGAAASWSSNTESTEWTFQLQPNGKWSDGNPVTSDDFEFAYHRILHPNFGAKYASMLYFIQGAEDYNKNHRELYLIKPLNLWDAAKEVNYRGNSELNSNKYLQQFFADLSDEEKQEDIESKGLNNLTLEQLQAIQQNPTLFKWPESLTESQHRQIIQTYIDNNGKDLWSLAGVGVQAVDALTLKINLKAPTPFLPELTKHYTWFPVPKHILSKLDQPFKKNFTWTDPGKLVSNGPFQLKDWQFNYFIEVEKNPLYWDKDTVQLNGIRFLPVLNTYTEARMFFNELLHVSYTLAPELIEYSKNNYSKFTRQETYLGCYFLRLNNSMPEFKDINLRKALAYSIDTQSIIDHVLKGGQEAATGLVPKMGSYTPADVFKFDPKLAQEYFAKTKFASNPKALKVNLITTDVETSKVLAETLQDMWNTHLGIDIEISQSDWKTYLGKMSKLDYGIAPGGWIGDYPDPTTFLDMWKKGDGNNRTGWSSDSYEAKLREAEMTADPSTRIKILQDAELILLNEFPIIPIYWHTTNYLVHDSLKGWHPSIMKNQPYKFLSLEN